MNTDIRLSVGFWQHPKTKKTARRLGLEGVRSLQVLWLWAAVSRPDGKLSGMDWEDIELAADWQGEEQAFFDLCLGMWIDNTQEGYILHDWKEHNLWAAEADGRSGQSRLAKLAQVNREAYDYCTAQGITSLTATEYADFKQGKFGGAQPPHSAPTATAQPPLANGTAPAPSPALKQEENTGGVGYCAHTHVASAVPECAESDSLKHPAPVGKPKCTDCPSKGNPEWSNFQSCYEIFPVQQGKEAAWCEWMRLHANGTLAAAWEIRDAILLLKAEDTRWQRGKVPKMARWLAEKGWDDKPFAEPAEAARASPGFAQGQPRATTVAQQRSQERDMMAKILLGAGNGDEFGQHAGLAGETFTALPASGTYSG